MITHRYNKVHINFKLNGKSFNNNTLKNLADTFVNHGAKYESEIGHFLLGWLSNKETIVVNTSGSTGKPKPIKLNKEAMVNSAKATGAFFNLQKGNKALLCLPVTYIAGKMMLVRALVLGLEIDCIYPSTTIAIEKEVQYDFVAMVPLQVQNSINHLKSVKTLIIGGAPLSFPLIKALKNLKTKVFETYGMTETITHIAVKKVNNFNSDKQASAYFKALPDINLSIDSRNCLVIEAPKLNHKKIITNDVVKLYSNDTFKWLGRYDNIINSGGIKINPEQIEQKLKTHIKERFFITSEADDLLGQKVILLVETDNKNQIEMLFDTLNKMKILNRYEKPKRIIPVSKFIETASGKIKRKEIIDTLKIK